MTLGIIAPLLVVPIALVVLWRWYRGAVERPGDDDAPTVDGIRLTAETLHRLPTPPWRVVYEIRESLPGIDHVVVGPAGVVAISTRMSDRPRPDDLVERQRVPTLVAEAASCRGRLDEVLGPANASCELSASVFWGLSDPSRPAAEDAIHRSPFVEGQRLTSWLADWNDASPHVFEPARIDAVWQTIVTGIGRPDPLR